MKIPPFKALAAVAALGLAMLLGSLGISVAAVALPSLARAFSASLAEAQWVISAYLLPVTVSILAVGRLGDLFGHASVLRAGLGLFAIASLLAAAAPNLGVLIAARALQGLGGAVLMALPMSLARELVPDARTGAAMGALGSMSAVGTALGPSLGGVLLDLADWRAPFWLLAGLAGATLVVSRQVQVAPSSGAEEPLRLDWVGMAVMAAALAAFALGAAGSAVAAPEGRALLLAAAALGAWLFFAVERRVRSPLISPEALADPATAAAMTANLLVASGMMATLVVGPFYLAFGLGLGEAWVGFVLAVGPATAAVAGAPAGWATDRFGADRVIVFGLLQAAFGFLCLALAPRFLGAPGFALALLVLTPGFQLFLAANNAATLAAAPRDRLGAVSGLLGLSRNLGFLSGAAVLGALFAAALGDDLPAAAPEAVADAFTLTFLTAAALMLVALAATRLGRWRAARSVAP